MRKNSLLILDYQENFADDFSIIAYAKIMKKQNSNLKYFYENKTFKRSKFEECMSNFNFDFDRIINADEQELTAVDGFGEVIAHSLKTYFSNAENRDLLDKALKYVRFMPEEKGENAEELAGKTFVVTGDMLEYKNRKELQKDIEARGGKVTGSVTKNTDYLINNDAFSTSAKNKKAAELGIPVITERQFMEMFIEK